MSLRLLTVCCLLAFSNIAVGGPPFGAGFEPAFRVARIRSALQRWESSSRKLEPVTDEHRNSLLRRRGEGYSAYALLTAAEFRGPVTVKALHSKYRWLTANQDDSTVQLAAMPRDQLDRLFVRMFTVRLDRESGLPTEIAFTTGDGKQPPAVAIRARRIRGRIKLVRATRPKTETVNYVEAKTPKPLDAKVVTILEAWGKASEQLQAAEAKASIYRYDFTFNRERRGTGSLRFKAPNVFRFEIQPARIPDGEKSRRIDRRTTRPFQLEPVRYLKLDSNGKTVNSSDESGKSFVLARVDPTNPKRLRRQFLLGGGDATSIHQSLFFPFMLGISATELKQSFRWTLLRNTKTEIWLQGRPRNPIGASQMRVCKVIVDTKTWLPKAVQLIDAAGAEETVYSFHDWKTVRAKR